MKNRKLNFDSLVGRIQATSEALQQDALVVINRSVTARAWLTGCYIVEYEQHGADRAKYGEGLLKNLAQRLSGSAFGLASLKNYRKFYQLYPELGESVAGYLLSRFGKSQSLISQLAIDVGESGAKGQSLTIGLLLCTEVGKEAAEYIAPYIDERLFISKYQLQLPGKEAFTEFLKKENEGLAKPVVTKKRKAKGSSK